MAIIPKDQEPANVKKRVDLLFTKLNEAYPDKVIVALQRDHKKWDETAREISRQLGYENKNDFLTAYGYKIVKLESGRPKSTHANEIIQELKIRYPTGSPFKKIDELKVANPDLAAGFKTLANQANSLFGVTFSKYLKSIGLLQESNRAQKKTITAEEKAEQRINNYKNRIDELISELKKRYPDFNAAPASFTELKQNNPDLPLDSFRRWFGIVYANDDLLSYFEDSGVINAQKNTQANTFDFEIINGVLYYHGKGGNITIPEGVETIGIEAFKNSNIHSVIIPDGVKKICNSAFANCKDLESVIISDTVNVIGSQAFKNCTNLKEVILSKKIVEISDDVFLKCESLYNIHLPEGLIRIGNRAFKDCFKLKHIYLPENLQSIGQYAFCKCENMESIEIPKDVTVINEGCFFLCGKLKNIVFSKGLKKIYNGALWGTAYISNKSNDQVTIGNVNYINCTYDPKNHTDKTYWGSRDSLSSVHFDISSKTINEYLEQNQLENLFDEIVVANEDFCVCGQAELNRSFSKSIIAILEAVLEDINTQQISIKTKQWKISNLINHVKDNANVIDTETVGIIELYFSLGEEGFAYYQSLVYADGVGELTKWPCVDGWDYSENGGHIKICQYNRQVWEGKIDEFRDLPIYPIYKMIWHKEFKRILKRTAIFETFNVNDLPTEIDPIDNMIKTIPVNDEWIHNSSFVFVDCGYKNSIESSIVDCYGGSTSGRITSKTNYVIHTSFTDQNSKRIKEVSKLNEQGKNIQLLSLSEFFQKAFIPNNINWINGSVFVFTCCGYEDSIEYSLVEKYGGIIKNYILKSANYLIYDSKMVDPYSKNGMTNKMKKACEWIQKGNRLKLLTLSDFFKKLT